MKKLFLSILVAGLLLSGNAFAKIDKSYVKQIYEGCISDAKQNNDYNSNSKKFCKCYANQFNIKFNNDQLIEFLSKSDQEKAQIVGTQLAPPCYRITKKTKSQKKDLNKDTSISCINVNTGSSRQYILENKNEIIYEGNYSWDFSENPFYITKEWNRQRIWVSFRDRVDTKIFEDIEIDRTTGVLLHRLSYPDGDVQRFVWNCKSTEASKF
tara:strand:+ start:424 stop:1056 length:633 start_codon:yes stop_codon:yes gene_type:complete